MLAIHQDFSVKPAKMQAFKGSYYDGYNYSYQNDNNEDYNYKKDYRSDYNENYGYERRNSSRYNHTYNFDYDGIDNDYYRNETDFYDQKIQECNDFIQNSNAPSGIKKVMNAVKVISTGLLEGWAVAWGASKSAKVLKSFGGKVLNSKQFNNVKNVTTKISKPIFEQAKAIFTLAKPFVSAAFGAVKLIGNKVVTEIEKQPFIAKFKEGKVGKFLTNAWDFTKKKFISIKEKMLEKYEFVKKEDKEVIYDKVTNVTSKTLGVGAGIAGAYNSATDADKRTEECFEV